MREGYNDPQAEDIRSGIGQWQDAYVWRMNNDYDAVIVFTGPEGVGKSTLSYELALLNDPSFKARTRTGFSVIDGIKIAHGLKGDQIVELDEGIEGLLNRDSMKKENKAWQKWMIVCRAKNLGVHICFPRFDSLDLYMREFRVWTWFQVFQRGKAWVRVRNWAISPEQDSPHYYHSYPAVACIKFPSIYEFREDREYVDITDWQQKQTKKNAMISEFEEEAISV